MGSADARGRWFQFGAFTPILISFLVILAGLGWVLHQSLARGAKITFNVRINGHLSVNHVAALNGESYQSGQPCGLGSKSLLLEAPGFEPFQTNLNISYAGAELGTIHLQRSHGTLGLRVSPKNNKIVINGEHARKELSDCDDATLTLPVGAYDISVAFKHFAVSRKVEIRRDSHETFRVQPETTSLLLQSEPKDANFTLWFNGEHAIKIEGTSPTQINDLPTGKYSLNIGMGEFRKNIPVLLAARKTNDISVEFKYPKVDLSSDPDGAQVRIKTKVIGTTPFTASLVPGDYKIRFEKDGHVQTSIDFTAIEGEHDRVFVKLENVAVLLALRDARSVMERFNPDFQLALRHVDSALALNRDAEALKLRDEILFKEKLAQAKALALRNDLDGALVAATAAVKMQGSTSAAVELKDEIRNAIRKRADSLAMERQALPLKVFSSEIARFSHHELFQTHTDHAEGDAATVYSDIVRSLEKRPSWDTNRKTKVADGIYLIESETRSLKSRLRALILIDQPDGSSSVKIMYRLAIYVLGNHIKVTSQGLSEDSWQPFHRNFSTLSPEFIERQGKKTFDDFRQKMTTELKVK